MPESKLGQLSYITWWDTIVKDRTATLNRQKTLRVALLARQAARRLTQIDAQIRAIDTATRALIENDPDLDRRRAILESIRGFGETTAIALLPDMPEPGTLDQKQAAALAGVCQHVAHEVHSATLPGRCEDLRDGGLDPLVRIGDHQLHAIKGQEAFDPILCSRRS